jgi:hypothetical protein
MPEPPALSDDQRAAARAKAIAARQARAQLKEDLKAGRTALAQVFESAAEDPVVAGTKMLVILESLPAVGKVKARRTMDTIGIAHSRRVRGVGQHQREKLLAAFPPSS